MINSLAAVFHLLDTTQLFSVGGCSWSSIVFSIQVKKSFRAYLCNEIKRTEIAEWKGETQRKTSPRCPRTLNTASSRFAKDKFDYNTHILFLQQWFEYTFTNCAQLQTTSRNNAMKHIPVLYIPHTHSLLTLLSQIRTCTEPRSVLLLREWLK